MAITPNISIRTTEPMAYEKPFSRPSTRRDVYFLPNQPSLLQHRTPMLQLVATFLISPMTNVRLRFYTMTMDVSATNEGQTRRHS